MKFPKKADKFKSSKLVCYGIDESKVYFKLTKQKENQEFELTKKKKKKKET